MFFRICCCSFSWLLFSFIRFFFSLRFSFQFFLPYDFLYILILPPHPDCIFLFKSIFFILCIFGYFSLSLTFIHLQLLSTVFDVLSFLFNYFCFDLFFLYTVSSHASSCVIIFIHTSVKYRLSFFLFVFFLFFICIVHPFLLFSSSFWTYPIFSRK